MATELTLKDRLVAAFLEQVNTNDPPDVRRSQAEAFATVAEGVCFEIEQEHWRQTGETTGGLFKHTIRRMHQAVDEARTRGGMRTGFPQAYVDASELDLLLHTLERCTRNTGDQ